MPKYGLDLRQEKWGKDANILMSFPENLKEKYLGEIAIIEEVKVEENGKLRVMIGHDPEKATDVKGIAKYRLERLGVIHPLFQQLVCPSCGVAGRCRCGKKV